MTVAVLGGRATLPKSERVVISTCSRESVGIDATVISAAPSSNSPMITNQALFVPFVVRNAALLAAQLFVRWSSGLSGNTDLGLYDAAGNRIVSTGATAPVSTQGGQVIDITDTLLGIGQYYFAYSQDNNLLRPVGFASGGNIAPLQNLGAVVGAVTMASAFPLPPVATFASISATAQYAPVPHMGLTGKTVF